MSRREYTSSDYTLYLQFVEEFDDKAHLLDTDCDGYGDGYIKITFNDEMLERYQPYGTVEELKAVFTDLSYVLGESDCAEIGKLKVRGWYEPPTICWSDPSCSDPGDGESTATIDLVSAEALYDVIKATLENAVIEVFEANNKAHEKYNREQPQSVEYMLAKYLEGVEDDSNINVAVYARVIKEIPWLCNDIIELDGEEI